MGSRERPVDVGAARGRELTATVLRELRLGRLDRNLSGTILADGLGISGAQYSRIEHGLVRGLTIEQASTLLAAVGLDLSVRVFPGGQPIRDAAHATLLDRLRAQVHRSLRVIAEVPLLDPGIRVRGISSSLVPRGGTPLKGRRGRAISRRSNVDWH